MEVASIAKTDRLTFRGPVWELWAFCDFGPRLMEQNLAKSQFMENLWKIYENNLQKSLHYWK